MKPKIDYLNALVEGNSVEIKKIYERNFLPVQRFVLQNKGFQEDSEDIFQKALLQIAVRYKREKFEIKSSFDAYLFTVCKNLWRRELNKSKMKVTNKEIRELGSDDQDASFAILEQKRWELFTENLNLISENCKKILDLFFSKISYPSIVREMNYNSETVARQRVFKCKNKLKELIKNDIRFGSLIEL